MNKIMTLYQLKYHFYILCFLFKLSIYIGINCNNINKAKLVAVKQ